MQTLGCVISPERKKEFVDKVTLLGINRCPQIGEMSYFESPWDGMFALDRFVKWITTYE